MSGVIFSSINSNNNALFGKFDIPIKAFTKEATRGKAENRIASFIFMFERSYRFAET